ncbi:MAG: glycosyltransferase family 4 protein [Magnetococcales bacterium]|nr:glycosyltransferase family 4 protein [Magnetococcales bacterium]
MAYDSLQNNAESGSQMAHDPFKNNSLRVALPISSFLPNTGGAEVGLHNIASRLQRAGHVPVVIAPEPHCRQLRQQGWNLPYEVVPFPPKMWGILSHWPNVGLWILDRFFSRLRKRYRFDVWHGTVGYPVGVALVHFARRHGNIAHLVRCAGEDIQKNSAIGYGARLDPQVDALIRTWLPQAQYLVAITESVSAEYRDLGVAETRIAPIPNGVDLERFQMHVDREKVRADLGIPAQACLFLAVGRNHPKKNFPALVQAAARLRQTHGGDFRVVIAGGNNETLLPLIRELNLEQTCILWNSPAKPVLHPGQTSTLQLPADDLVALYRSADVFVFPSLIETFGIVLVEAMAAGLPIITTLAPGCRDIIRQGVDGILVPPGDEKPLAEAMAQLLQDPAARAHWAARARARSLAFSWDTVVKKYIDLYHRAVAQTRA